MNKVVTLAAAVPANVFLPSASLRIGYIQNTGSNDASLTFDGSDPSDTTGFLLPAGQQLWLPQGYGSAVAGMPRPWPQMRGFSASGTTLRVGADDNGSI